MVHVCMCARVCGTWFLLSLINNNNVGNVLKISEGFAGKTTNPQKTYQQFIDPVFLLFIIYSRFYCITEK